MPTSPNQPRQGIKSTATTAPSTTAELEALAEGVVVSVASDSDLLAEAVASRIEQLERDNVAVGSVLNPVAPAPAVKLAKIARLRQLLEKLRDPTPITGAAIEPPNDSLESEPNDEA